MLTFLKSEFEVGKIKQTVTICLRWFLKSRFEVGQVKQTGDSSLLFVVSTYESTDHLLLTINVPNVVINMYKQVTEQVCNKGVSTSLSTNK